MQEYEVSLPGREAVALKLMRELMDRGLEAPTNTEAVLTLYCRCLMTVCHPDRATPASGSIDASAPSQARPSEPPGDF